MRKSLVALTVVLAAFLTFIVPAGAQDEPVIGSVEVDPPIVPEAGEYEVTANGSGFIPDTQILVGSCTAPGDTLVFGTSTTEEITETLGSIDVLLHCDVATASQADVDSDGNWTLTKSVEIGDNFAFSAGALDGSQQGAVWIPIGDPAAAELAVTGASSSTLALAGIAALMLGVLAVGASRRFQTI